MVPGGSMARPIIVSNGSLHVGINNYGLVHDVYFPYVGHENHAAGKHLRHKVGVWVEGQCSWLDDGNWTFYIRTSDQALAGYIRAKNERLGVILEFEDFVDTDEPVFMRNIHVVNLHDKERDIRLFLHQAFAIGDSRSNTDTAQYLPDSKAILHYRGRRAFVISAREDNGDFFDQRSIGLFGIEGREGTFKDAEDGELANGFVEHGRVDSTLRLRLNVAPHSSRRVHYWFAAGEDIREALNIHKNFVDHADEIHRRYKQTVQWWKRWLMPAQKVAHKLPRDQRELFLKSAMYIKAHIDKNGAIIASTDTAMLNYSRDAYGYCWPRDGAYALWPLIRLGYEKEPMQFFEFMLRAMHPSGYLMHKYRADGALGSSWHPYEHGSIHAPPIQEDETALVLFMYAQFYNAHHDNADLPKFYEPFIKPMADFMVEYIDPTTNLPRPSYDLWEEKFITSTYTVAVVHVALLAAAELAEAQGQSADAVQWRSTAERIRESARKYLYSEEKKLLRKGFLHQDGEIHYDDTLDSSSFYGAFIFGLFESTSEEIKTTLEAMQHTLRGKNQPAGLQRYEQDVYRKVSDSVPSNPWIITSLWEAQYYLELNETERADEILEWVARLASDTGMFAEQVHPFTGEPLSISPLVWSHAEYMATMLDSLTEHRDG